MNVAVPPPLADLLTEVGLDPAAAGLGRRPRSGAGYLCLPSVDQPQLLVPLAPAGSDLVLERRSRTLPARAAKQLVAAGLRARVLNRMPIRRLSLDDPALTDLVAWLGGRPGDLLGVLVGPPRANRKPVLRLLSDTGATTAFAKLGATPVAADLVRREAAALVRVADHGWTTLRPPRLLKAGQWRGREVVVTEALARDAQQRQPTALPIGPTREIATTGARSDLPVGETTTLGLDGADTWGPWRPELETLTHRLRAAVGDRRLPLGASHGDWTPWNMAWSGDLLEVWDWERYATDLPQGFDVVHFAASSVRAHEPGDAEERFLRTLPGLLADCGVDAGLTSPVLALYLLTAARRYAADLTLVPAPLVSTRLDWVLRLLRSETDRLERGAVA